MIQVGAGHAQRSSVIHRQQDTGTRAPGAHPVLDRHDDEQLGRLGRGRSRVLRTWRSVHETERNELPDRGHPVGRKQAASTIRPSTWMSLGSYGGEPAALGSTASVHPHTRGKEQTVVDRVIANPIINSPYRAPEQHFNDGITNEIVEGRGPSSYFVPVPRPRKRGQQMELECPRPGTRFPMSRSASASYSLVRHLRQLRSCWSVQDTSMTGLDRLIEMGYPRCRLRSKGRGRT